MGWVTIDVKVEKELLNEADPWVEPSPSEVAALIRERLEGENLATGWKITKVSAGTQGLYPDSVMDGQPLRTPNGHRWT